MTTPSSHPAGDSSVPPPGAFGSMPAAHPQTHHPTPTRPRSVDIAFLIFVVSFAVGILQNILFLSTGYATTGGSLFSIALGAAAIAVSFQMRAGQNWARITLTVLAGIVLVFGVIGLLGLMSVLGLLGALPAMVVLSLVLAVVSLVALVVGLVMMFRAESNTYFSG